MILLLLFTSISPLIAKNSNAIKRGRNEGTYTIPASNVLSNGNITAFVKSGINISSSRLGADAIIGGAIGLADLMQLTASVSFLDFNHLGTTEAHLQFTTPRNSRLRFFGLGVIGDLYLSSSLDTIGKTADSTKPDFTPYPLFSAVIDFDFITKPQKLPLKTYLYFSMADNPDLLFEYKQLSFRYGIELKKYEHSLFIEGQTGVYKEKYPRATTPKGYSQYCSKIYAGGRYRIRKRFSFMGSAGVAILKNSYNSGGFNPSLFSVSLKFEAPLLYRESETEAIRSLIYLDKIKAKTNTGKLNNSNIKNNHLNKVLNEIESSTGSFDMKNENRELIQKRKEVQDQMDKIELMLEEDM